MCLAIPMQVISVEGFLARCQAGGIEREVSLFLLQDEHIRSGDYVMVHVGYAIQKVEAQRAAEAWALHEQLSRGDA
ncbi:MAG TPA: HypC/HybG/HupF family hydrogenase formation chaperone [Gammaproteobacteria bacterium]